MTTHLALLPSVELVLLPGMVVPVHLDGEAQAAVDAATAQVRELAGEYRGVVISILQQRGAWQLLDVADRIRTDVREGMDKAQREFLLRQQLAAIRKELGEDDGDAATDYRARISDADLPGPVAEVALREVSR